MRRIFFLIPFFFVFLHSQSIDPKSKIGYESFNASDLKSYITVLSSDSLEGRETSYPGQKKAAQYIAGIFKNLHLEAVGDDKTYFQHFDVEVTRVHPETKMLSEVNGTKKSYILGTDFIVKETKDTIVSGPAAFIGFTDAELDSSDRAKLAGRVVFVFIGKKSYANDSSRAGIMRRLYAIRRDAGALATFTIPDIEGVLSFEHAHELMTNFDLGRGSMQMKRPGLEVPSKFIRFLISTKLAEEVLRPTGKSLKQVRDLAIQDEQFRPIFIDNVSLTIKSKIIHETKQTENVLGLLPGSDPELKTQVVAFTAHYDHLGKNPDGVFYPGADDDGSGTATVLELAKAFTNNPIRPKRSLLFLTVVGEEKGLFGSQYYTSNPIIPLSLTIADLNIDMIGRMDTVYEAMKDTNSIYVIGSDKISLELDSLLQAANEESEHLTLDYKFNDENDPDQYYRRSDHFNFAKNGVPIAFFFDGNHADYHKPTDTADKILFGRMVKIGHVIYDLGWKLANFDQLLIKRTGQ